MQEHKYKLLMFSGLVASICLVSSLLCISVKVYQSYWPSSRPGRSHQQSSRASLDLDTVSSEMELSADFTMQDSQDSQDCKAPSSCQTFTSATRSELKPKGILKNSRTSENFRFVHIWAGLILKSVLLKTWVSGCTIIQWMTVL